MKKNLLLLCMLLCSINIFSQSIKSCEIDDFTGNKVIYTTTEKLTKETFTKPLQTMFYFRYENGKDYLHLLWQCREMSSVLEGGTAIFILSDGNKMNLKSIKYTIAEPSVASTSMVKPSKILGLDLAYVGDDLKLLKVGTFIQKFRIYTSSGYQDFEVSEDKAKLLTSAYLLVQEKK